MRLVRCCITKEMGNLGENGFVRINGKYYKSEEIYTQFGKEKEYKDKTFDFIKNNFLKSDVADSYLGKKIKDIKIQYEKIYNDLESKYEVIKSGIESNNIVGDYKIISYIFKIIEICENEIPKLKIAGIYRIINQTNNNTYIGESVDIFRRQTEHITMLFQGTHHNKALQYDFNLYGIENFSFEPLYILDTSNKDKNEIKNYLLYLESAFYKKHESYHTMYNTTIPYYAIFNKHATLEGYEIDYDLIIELLKTNPCKIEFGDIIYSDNNKNLTDIYN